MKLIMALLSVSLMIYGIPEQAMAQWDILPVLDVAQVAYNDVTLTDINTIYIGGRGSGLSGAFILKSADAGTTWVPTTLPSGMQINEVTKIFFPISSASLVGYAVASVINEGYKVFRTFDAGLNWTLVSIPQYQFGFDIRDLFFYDIATGFFTVRYGSPPVISIFKTTDAGSSWTETPTPAGISDVTFITAASSSEYFIAASDSFQNAIMLYTSDGGNSWQKLSTGAYNIIKPIFHAGNIYATASDTAIFSNDVIVKGTNTAGNWNWDSLHTIRGFSEDIDLTWQNIYLSANFWNGMANVGKFYRSGDLGNSWQNMELPNENHINEMIFVTEAIGYAVGDSAFQKPLFFKTTDGGGLVGIKQISSNVIKDYYLKQNYPNPFNPSTTIEFDLPEAAEVKLIIYNTLGEEVSTLVNGHLSAGQHRTTWQADDLPSGVYFYRLSSSPLQMGTKGNVQTRKMLLIR